VAEDCRPDRSGGEANHEGAERDERARQRIAAGKEQGPEVQGDSDAVEVEVEPLMMEPTDEATRALFKLLVGDENDNGRLAPPAQGVGRSNAGMVGSVTCVPLTNARRIMRLLNRHASSMTDTVSILCLVKQRE
jgi:hypothetical protein